MHSCLDPVLEAQREGLKVGDTSYATLCAVIYCNIAFRCKKKLSLVKKNFDRSQKGSKGIQAGFSVESGSSLGAGDLELDGPCR